MSKFNTKTATTFGGRKTTNLAGGEAFVISKELELYSLVVTGNFENKYYESTSSQTARLRELVRQVDPVFIAKLAIYAREQMYMRTMPIALMVELARIHSGDSLVASALNRTIQRADEITETLAYFSKSENRSGTKKLNKIPHGLLNGLKKSFNKFNEYQFAKYNTGKEIKLRDALFLVHPAPKDSDQQKIFDKIAAGTLATPETWEVSLSATGHGLDESEKLDAKKEAWSEMINSGKLGYMALLRNLRNILNTNVSLDDIKIVVSRLSNQEEVLRSKQFPFRFFSAYRELEYVSSPYAGMVLNALEAAMMYSAANIAGYDENTTVFIATDFSGSMDTTISERSKIRMNNIGVTLAMLLNSRCKSVINGIFGEHYKTMPLPSGGVLQNISNMCKSNHGVGHSTNGWKAIQFLNQNNIKVDKVMVFSDLQLYNSGGNSSSSISKQWATYRESNPDAKIYLFDLAGHGTTPIDMKSGQNVYLISGWSEKVFDMLNKIENQEDVLSEIRSITI